MMSRNWFTVEIRGGKKSPSFMQPVCHRCGARGSILTLRSVRRMIADHTAPGDYPINQWLDNHPCGLID